MSAMIGQVVLYYRIIEKLCNGWVLCGVKRKLRLGAFLAGSEAPDSILENRCKSTLS
jgi:hypothetical protein